MFIERKLAIGVVIVAGALANGVVYAEGLRAQDGAPGEVPPCVSGQMDGVDHGEDVAAHRQFELPVLEYPADYKLQRWGMPLTLLVGPSGRIVCQTAKDAFGHEREMTGPRRELLRAMSTWHYRPFLRGGRPASVVIDEFVSEERLPRSHRSLPEVALDQVTISLWRTGCFGTCPAYGVRVHGDGTVEYEGRGFVDVLGKHAYRIPSQEVASLVTELRNADLWSMEASYRSLVTDNPTYRLTLQVGDEIHEIEDYVGAGVGMPSVITHFEDEVDRVARSSDWTTLSVAAVDQLQREGFDFRSQAAADLLARAVANDQGRDELAMLRMIRAGTPVTGGSPLGSRTPPGRTAQTSLLESALLHHRTLLIDPLLVRGSLRTDGALDGKKVNAAFRSAIEGGRLSPVQKIWSLTTPGTRPSLWFEDKDDNGNRRQVPVTMLLSRPYLDGGWEGKVIAKWLAGMGCDLMAHAADGDTLLHRAVDAGDIAFVRYLLAKGLEVSAPGNYGLPPLASAKDEDLALLLLQSGSDWRMDDRGEGFILYARNQHWGRVVTWLRQHGK